MHTILVANRGEVAIRIIRTAKEMGLSTVAVFSEADRNSLHVKLSDRAICIGPAEAQKSYLDMSRIMAVLEATGADLLHPGYGFLSENPKLAEAVIASGKIFVGPPPGALELIGDKTRARKVAKAVGMKLLPGSEGPVDFSEAISIAQRIGYPVVIKANSGGGGKGIRVVQNEKELRERFYLSSREADASFGDPRVYVEKFLLNPKHIEVQVLVDRAKNVLILGDRECSIQRRHQKLIEEAPSPSLDDIKREELFKQVRDFCIEIGFEGAGTVEFLMDSDGNLYFMEMNGRLQVEHPVTEMVFGIDIVEWQIRIALGQSLKSTALEPKGCAIECRLNAEDPNTFMPSPGKVEELFLPGGFGIRVDTHLYCGYEVPPYYDSLLLKLIAWGSNRTEAISRLQRALEELKVSGRGLKTNKEFHIRVLSSREFRFAKHHTRLVEEMLF
ncbi:MAG: acetyl-CoA carboxylase biotin carboxylase subunit [Aquificaceae bacterium]